MLITFNTEIDDISLQVGDSVYYNTIDQDFTDPMSEEYYASYNDPILLGKVLNISPSSIDVAPENLQSIPNVPANSFVLYAKDARANKSGLKGYYAKVKLQNDSTEKIELFSFSSGVTQSSK
tara:strand:+ start:643 stop:1008 length:366 start_codon:yes stop_codon:yes gene_type:complete